MVRRQRHQVLLAQPFPVQFPDEIPGVGSRHLEHRQGPHVGQQGILHDGGQVGQLGQALGGQDEAGPELAQLAEHGLVVHPGQGLHLVHHLDAPPLAWRQIALLSDHGVHQVEPGRPHQGGHVPACRGLGGGHQERPTFGMTRRRSMVERDWPRMERAFLEASSSPGGSAPGPGRWTEYPGSSPWGPLPTGQIRRGRPPA